MDTDNFDEEGPAQESEATLAVAQPAELPEIKLFGRWSCDDVQVSDMSLQVFNPRNIYWVLLKVAY